MIFYYNGKKPSKGFDIASGCFLLIAIGAIIFLFTLIDSFEDLEGNYLEIFFIFVMVVSLFYGFFKKKGKLHTHKIELKNDFLYINNLKISIDNIQLNIYRNSTSFCRYHFWDYNGILSIYSVFEDDFLNYFLKNYADKTFNLEEISSSGNGSNVRVKTNNGNLNYDLESGGYSITKEDKIISNKVPELYVYDPKYKKGVFG